MNHPQAHIANDQLRAAVCLPDVKSGFYRGTRFDWSGVVSSLEYQGHQYYGAWYTKFVPAVHDFAYEDVDVSVGPGGGVMAWTYTYTYHAVET